MNANDTDPVDIEPTAVTKWDPGLTERVMGILRPLIKGYHRAEVRGLEDFPKGGALVVGNHSGGLFAMDVPVFATGFYEKFGFDRPVYTLSHDIIFAGPTGDFFRKTGFIPANHENADEALRSGGVVVVFPGGDYDVYRPTRSESKIDFGGRTGYVRAAINAGVPIVPSVSIGGQEAQLFLSRGEGWPRRSDSTSCCASRSCRSPSDSRSDSRPCYRSTCRCRRRSSRRCCLRSTSSPSSAKSPTSTRSTRTYVRSCSRHSTSWPSNAGSPCWADGPWR